MGKEPWNSSTDKAQTLKIDDFGKPDEVKERAKPVRTANNRQQAVAILKKISSRGPIVSKSGLNARLSTKSIGKIVSNQALNISCSPEAHYLAAANLDYLFKNAIEPWKFELNPGKNNDGIKERRYLYAPMGYGKEVIIIKFTVKEYLDENLKNKIYSIEAIDTKKQECRYINRS
jgi:hypothetical protein